MGAYEDKLANVVALGNDVWVAEYRFRDNSDANRAASMVAHHVPEIVQLARSGKADMVVGDFDGRSQLFFGGLIDDDVVDRAHRALLICGGTLEAARRPPESKLKLTAQGTEGGEAPVYSPSGTEAYASPARPWWKFWG